MPRTPLKESLAAQGIEVETPEIIVGDDSPTIDPIGQDVDLGKLARNEAFMAEPVTIRVATTTDPNANPYITITVNDVTNRVQFPRGLPVRVKRCHLEVLARMKETTYTQPPRNPMNPEAGNELIPRTVWSYPFELVEDKNPIGRAWLERVMAEAQ